MWRIEGKQIGVRGKGRNRAVRGLRQLPIGDCCPNENECGRLVDNHPKKVEYHEEEKNITLSGRISKNLRVQKGMLFKQKDGA